MSFSAYPWATRKLDLEVVTMSQPPRAKMPSQEKGAVPKPLPRDGGHISHLRGNESLNLVSWLRRLGAPEAYADVVYHYDVILLVAEPATVIRAYKIGAGAGGLVYFAVLRSDWEGEGGIQAILGNRKGRGEKKKK